MTSDKLDWLTSMKNRIQAGNNPVIFKTTGSGGGATTVNFPVAFSTTPIVIATPRDNNASVVAVHLLSVSATSFSILGRTNAGVDISGSFNWVAFLP